VKVPIGAEEVDVVKGLRTVLAVSGVALFSLHPASLIAGETKMVEVLFVQSARDVVFDAGTMTLKNVSPTTLFFSDRPERIAGHYANEEYLKIWTEGRDSFLKDPPNAVVSVFDRPGHDPSDVVVTLSKPRIQGHDLTYDIRLIRGTPPPGGATAVFIDIIGLPFTPLSFAGVARRTAYRSVAWSAAASESAAASSQAAASQDAAASAQQSAASAAAASEASAAAAKKAATAASAAAPAQTPQQRLESLKSLYEQGLISKSDYEAAKAKILAQITQ
jgi:hypothetical protein